MFQFNQASKLQTLLSCTADIREAGLSKAAAMFEDRSQPVALQQAALLALCGGPIHHFLFALRLREHVVGVSVQQLFFARISGSFSSDACPQLVGVLAETLLLQELRVDVAVSTEFLQRSVYDIIDGTDYDRLAVFYDLMANLNSDPVTAATARLLSKIRVVCVGLDFKKLINGTDAVIMLKGSLNEDNVSVVAKLGNQIPFGSNGSGKFLSSSIVYQIFATIVFAKTLTCKEVQGGLDDRSAVLPDLWLRSYSRVRKLYANMEPVELEQFMTDAVVSQQGVDLPMKIRCHVVKDILSVLKCLRPEGLHIPS